MDEQEKTRRPGVFGPGNNANPAGRPKDLVKVPPILRDMRWAYRNEGNAKKGTPAQNRFRDMLRDKPGEFLAALDRLERQYKPSLKAQAKVEPQKVEATPGEDVGTELALGLIERWLHEWPGTLPPEE